LACVLFLAGNFGGKIIVGLGLCSDIIDIAAIFFLLV
jgi:hypothetical protein